MIELILTGALALLLLGALLAPFEALGSWAGWFGEEDVRDWQDAQPFLPQPGSSEPTAPYYLVYLSGIGAISGDSIPAEEVPFLDLLEDRLAEAVLIRDVFPYSVANRGLTGQRLFARLWRLIERLRMRNPGVLLAHLINLRNLFQVAVSVDRRYEAIYNLGVAGEIAEALRRQGYGGEPIALIGWSGGGQIAVGATTYLARLTRAPIYVISLGGVLSADAGLLHLRRLYHLFGDEDPVQGLGQYVFPGRWPVARRSPWNRARREGRITCINLGPIRHNAPRNYFDPAHRLPDGRTCAERTCDAIMDALAEAGLHAA